MKDKSGEKSVFFIETKNMKAYFCYNEDEHVCTHCGKSVTISKEKFCDFLHTARELGFKTGEV